MPQSPFPPRPPLSSAQQGLMGLDWTSQQPQSPLSPPSQPLQLDILQRKRQRELQERLTREQRSYGRPQEMGGLKNMLGMLDEDIAGGAVEQQRPQVEAIEASNQAAMQQGFHGGPGQNPGQEAAVYNRGLAEEKMRQPMAQTQAEQSGAFQRGQLANEGALSLQQEKQRGEMEQIEEFSKFRTDPNRSVSISGLGSIGAARVSTAGAGGSINPLLKSVFDARQSLALAQNSGNPISRMFGGGSAGESRAQAALDQALANVYAQHPAADDIKGLAQRIQEVPGALELTDLNQIYDMVDQAQAAKGEGPLRRELITPNDATQLSEFLAILRGKM